MKNKLLNNSSPEKIVLASGNKKKIKELEQLLTPLSISILPQAEFNIDDAIEDGLSFVENALIKARHASRLSGLPAVADDSGLVVDALEGRPGIYSARFAGEPSDDEANNRLLLEQMSEVSEPQRSARFVCVLECCSSYAFGNNETPCWLLLAFLLSCWFVSFKTSFSPSSVTTPPASLALKIRTVSLSPTPFSRCVFSCPIFAFRS